MTLFIEAAWNNARPARISRTVLARQEGLPKAVTQAAWNAQLRLHQRYQHLTGVGRKKAQVAAAALGRELAGFVWAIGHLCLSAPAAIACAGFGRDGISAFDGGQRALEVIESGGASAGECAASVCATEQCLSAAGTVSVMPSAADGAGTRNGLKENSHTVRQSGLSSAPQRRATPPVRKKPSPKAPFIPSTAF